MPPGHISSGVSDALDQFEIDEAMEDELLEGTDSITTVQTAVPAPSQESDESTLVIDESKTPSKSTTNTVSNSGSTSNDLSSRNTNDNLAPSVGLVASRPIPVDLTLGRPCDYVPVLQVVDAWQFAQNPPGVTRMPYDGLEAQIKHRLNKDDEDTMRTTAIRNGNFL